MIRLLVTVLGSRCSEAAAAGVAPPIAGYYSWNWGKGSSPAGGNNGVAFTGLTDVRMVSGHSDVCKLVDNSISFEVVETEVARFEV